jgi:hypothetical protein
MYDELKLDRIQATLETLRDRITERFPESSLSGVAGELCRIAADTGPVLERVRRPNRLLRAGVAVAVGLVILVVAWTVVVVVPDLSLEVDGIGALFQATESAVQDLIFLGLAIWFLVTLETRLDRRVSLRALHRLRTIVHIVDMHQLTKDPESLLTPGRRTPSSPERGLTRFQLVRYLDYCSELLSLSSKLAALHVQYVNDPVVLEAVNDIEVLASDLANQMWQKIVILDTVAMGGNGDPVHVGTSPNVSGPEAS